MQILVSSLILYNPPKFLMILGQMASLKYRMESLESNLRTFLHVTPEKWSMQVIFFAYAHKTLTLSISHVSLYGKIFHSQTRIPLDFRRSLLRKTIVYVGHNNDLTNHINHFINP